MLQRSGTTRRLLRARLHAFLHMVRAQETGDRLRLGLVLTAGLGGLLVAANGLLEQALGAVGTDAFEGMVRLEIYRVAAVLAALSGFASFERLWRSADLDILNRLPIDPVSILRLRALEALLLMAPLTLLGMAAFAPLAWHGAGGLLGEAILALALTVATSVATGMAWHVFAGDSVTRPEWEAWKQRLAGTLVLPDRTFLLYSPLLAAVSGFLSGLLALIATAALARADYGVTLLGLALACMSGPLAWRHAEGRSRRSYYETLAALADGELLGELGESAPGPEFFGRAYAERLPSRVGSLVAKDLRQAWRRSRADHLLLGAVSLLVAIDAGRRGPGDATTTLVLVWATLVLTSGQAFRLSRDQTDAAWLWLSLPASLPEQVLARWLAVLFFSLMLSPALLYALNASGLGLAEGIALWACLSAGGAGMAVGLSLIFFTKRRMGTALYAMLCVGLVFLLPVSIWAVAGAGLLMAVALGIQLRQVRATLLAETLAR